MTSLISAQNVNTVAGFLKGKRLEKFRASIEILRTAEARGSWMGIEARKASSGFYQGLIKRPTMFWGMQAVERRTLHTAEMCLMYGRPYTGPIPVVEKVPSDVVEAWLKLCWEVWHLTKELNEARPKPVVTAVGLSPKVTKTLLECDLDIVLPTIRPADIEAIKVPEVKDGQRVLNKDGTPKMETVYRVKWTPGTQLGKSRFWSGCQACGKPIPSNRYVAIEAECRKNGRIGLWIGCDCAKNIFGIKDKGIAKE